MVYFESNAISLFSVLYSRVHDGRRERLCHLLEVGGTGGGR